MALAQLPQLPSQVVQVGHGGNAVARVTSPVHAQLVLQAQDGLSLELNDAAHAAEGRSNEILLHGMRGRGEGGYMGGTGNAGRAPIIVNRAGSLGRGGRDTDSAEIGGERGP